MPGGTAQVRCTAVLPGNPWARSHTTTLKASIRLRGWLCGFLTSTSAKNAVKGSLLRSLRSLWLTILLPLPGQDGSSCLLFGQAHVPKGLTRTDGIDLHSTPRVQPRISRSGRWRYRAWLSWSVGGVAGEDPDNQEHQNGRGPDPSRPRRTAFFADFRHESVSVPSGRANGAQAFLPEATAARIPNATSRCSGSPRFPHAPYKPRGHSHRQYRRNPSPGTPGKSHDRLEAYPTLAPEKEVGHPCLTQAQPEL